MKYIAAVLVRPRSRQYAHLSCIEKFEAQAPPEKRDDWADRKQMIPVVDAADLICLLCDKPLTDVP